MCLGFQNTLVRIEETATTAAAAAVVIVVAVALLFVLPSWRDPGNPVRSFPTGARRVTRLLCGVAASYSAGGA